MKIIIIVWARIRVINRAASVRQNERVHFVGILLKKPSKWHFFNCIIVAHVDWRKPAINIIKISHETYFTDNISRVNRLEQRGGSFVMVWIF